MPEHMPEHMMSQSKQSPLTRLQYERLSYLLIELAESDEKDKIPEMYTLKPTPGNITFALGAGNGQLTKNEFGNLVFDPRGYATILRGNHPRYLFTNAVRH